MLERVCAWCGTCLGSKDGEGIEGSTGGICERCLTVQLARLSRSRARASTHPKHEVGARR